MAEVKASEVIGELRKAARMYEIFQKAEAATMVLVDLEAREAKLVKNISALETEQKRVDADITARIAEYEKKAKEAMAHATSVERDAKAVLEDSNATLARAKNEAAAIIAKARSDADLIRDSIKNLKKEESGLQVVVQGLKRASEEMIKEMHDKRDALLKAFS